MSQYLVNERYSLHYGWGNLFKEAIADHDISLVGLEKDKLGGYDIRDLRKVHYDAIDKCGTSEFSLDISKNVNCFTFDIYSLMLYSSPNLRQLLIDATENLLYITPQIRVKMLENKDNKEIWFFSNSIKIEDEVTVVGFAALICTILKICCESTGADLYGVQYNIPKTRYSRSISNNIKKRFGIKVVESKLHHHLVIKNNILDIPTINSNSATYNLCKTNVKNKVALMKGEDIVCKIHQILDGMESLKNVTASYVASQLYVSSRTLNRKLSNVDCTFKTVIDNYKTQLAIRLLKETNENLNYVAFKVGFSDQSSFSRAFKRWTGEQPHVTRSQR